MNSVWNRLARASWAPPASRLRHTAVTAALLCLVAGAAVGAEPPHAAGASKYFQGLTLVDQNGANVDLYALMKDRTIVINSFFATCTASCPVTARTLQALQVRYAERLGKDLVLVSITVDPEKDTPAKLKEHARHLKAAPGWYFLTGSKAQVDLALKRIGQQVESPDQHTNVMIIGNEKTGLWKKAFSLAKVEDIVEIVGSVLNDDGTAPVK